MKPVSADPILSVASKPQGSTETKSAVSVLAFLKSANEHLFLLYTRSTFLSSRSRTTVSSIPSTFYARVKKVQIKKKIFFAGQPNRVFRHCLLGLLSLDSRMPRPGSIKTLISNFSMRTRGQACWARTRSKLRMSVPILTNITSINPTGIKNILLKASATAICNNSNRRTKRTQAVVGPRWPSKT